MPDRDLTEALLGVLRARMDEQRISGRALAERVGIEQTTLARKLRGVGDLTVDELDRAAVALGARDAEELLTEARRSL